METSARYRLLAKACREVSDACVQPGTQPFGVGYVFRNAAPCCGLGHVIAHAGYTLQEELSSSRAVRYYVGEALSKTLKHHLELLAYHNDREYPAHRNSIVSRYLRDLAELLDYEADSK